MISAHDLVETFNCRAYGCPNATRGQLCEEHQRIADQRAHPAAPEPASVTHLDMPEPDFERRAVEHGGIRLIRIGVKLDQMLDTERILREQIQQLLKQWNKEVT